MALLRDPVLRAHGAPRVEVVATAKRDLSAGETLDGRGGFMSYGQCETTHVAAREGLLPMGVAEGALLRRAVACDQVLRYDDVALPPDRLIDQLRCEQAQLFAGEGAVAA